MLNLRWHIFFLALVVLAVNPVAGQTCAGGTVSTQADWTTTYASCVTVTSSLTISITDATSIGASTITSIQGGLTIHASCTLTDLDLLQNLQTAGTLSIVSNPALISVSLPALVMFNNQINSAVSLTVSNNAAMTSFSMPNLATSYRGMSWSNMPLLTTFNVASNGGTPLTFTTASTSTVVSALGITDWSGNSFNGATAHLSLSGLTALTTLSGLTGPFTLFKVDNCDSLPNLNGVTITSGSITSNFVITNNAVLTSIAALGTPLAASMGSIEIRLNPALTDLGTVLSTPVSASIIYVDSNTVLTTVSLPAMTTMTNQINSAVTLIVSNNAAMTSFSMPNLATSYRGMSWSNMPLLTTFNVASNGGTPLTFTTASTSINLSGLSLPHLVGSFAGTVVGKIFLTGNTPNTPDDFDFKIVVDVPDLRISSGTMSAIQVDGQVSTFLQIDNVGGLKVARGNLTEVTTLQVTNNGALEALRFPGLSVTTPTITTNPNLCCTDKSSLGGDGGSDCSGATCPTCPDVYIRPQYLGSDCTLCPCSIGFCESTTRAADAVNPTCYCEPPPPTPTVSFNDHSCSEWNVTWPAPTIGNTRHCGGAGELPKYNVTAWAFHPNNYTDSLLLNVNTTQNWLTVPKQIELRVDVRAFFDNGPMSSESHLALHHEPIPPGPPTNFNATAVAFDTISVTWDHPAYTGPCQPAPDSFRIYWKLPSQSAAAWSHTISASSGPYVYNITGLNATTTYDVVVGALAGNVENITTVVPATTPAVPTCPGATVSSQADWLSPVRSCLTITGTLTLQVSDATALPPSLMKRVQGDLVINGGTVTSWTTLFPNLVQVDGHVVVQGAGAQNVAFPELVNITGVLRVLPSATALVSLAVPKMGQGFGIELQAPSLSSFDISSTSAPLAVHFIHIQQYQGTSWPASSLTGSSVDQSLIISDSKFTSLSGLSVQTAANTFPSFALYANPDLTNLAGVTLGGEYSILVVTQNAKLADISAPGVLTAGTMMNITISANPLLTALGTALDGVKMCQVLAIDNNNALPSLSMANLIGVQNHFFVYANPAMASILIPQLQLVTCYMKIDTGGSALTSWNIASNATHPLQASDNVWLSGFGTVSGWPSNSFKNASIAGRLSIHGGASVTSLSGLHVCPAGLDLNGLGLSSMAGITVSATCLHWGIALEGMASLSSLDGMRSWFAPAQTFHVASAIYLKNLAALAAFGDAFDNIVNGNSFKILDCGGLTNVTLPSLRTLFDDFSLVGSAAVSTISIPNLGQVDTQVFIANTTALAHLSIATNPANPIQGNGGETGVYIANGPSTTWDPNNFVKGAVELAIENMGYPGAVYMTLRSFAVTIVGSGLSEFQVEYTNALPPVVNLVGNPNLKVARVFTTSNQLEEITVTGNPVLEALITPNITNATPVITALDFDTLSQPNLCCSDKDKLGGNGGVNCLTSTCTTCPVVSLSQRWLGPYCMPCKCAAGSGTCADTSRAAAWPNYKCGCPEPPAPVQGTTVVSATCDTLNVTWAPMSVSGLCTPIDKYSLTIDAIYPNQTSVSYVPRTNTTGTSFIQGSIPSHLRGLKMNVSVSNIAGTLMSPVATYVDTPVSQLEFPGPVGSPIVNIGFDTLDIEWLAPTPSICHSPVRNYIVTYSGLNVAGPIARTLPATARTFNITRLTASATYDVEIAVVGESGFDGPRTNVTSLQYTTDPPVAPGPVTGLTATGITATSLTVNWVASTLTGGAGPNTYKVLVPALNATYTTTSNTYLVQGLTPETTYNISVVTQNAANLTSTPVRVEIATGAQSMVVSVVSSVAANAQLFTSGNVTLTATMTGDGNIVTADVIALTLSAGFVPQVHVGALLPLTISTGDANVPGPAVLFQVKSVTSNVVEFSPNATIPSGMRNFAVSFTVTLPDLSGSFRAVSEMRLTRDTTVLGTATDSTTISVSPRVLTQSPMTLTNPVSGTVATLAASLSLPALPVGTVLRFTFSQATTVFTSLTGVQFSSTSAPAQAVLKITSRTPTSLWLSNHAVLAAGTHSVALTGIPIAATSEGMSFTIRLALLGADNTTISARAQDLTGLIVSDICSVSLVQGSCGTCLQNAQCGWCYQGINLGTPTLSCTSNFTSCEAVTRVTADCPVSSACSSGSKYCPFTKSCVPSTTYCGACPSDLPVRCPATGGCLTTLESCPCTTAGETRCPAPNEAICTTDVTTCSGGSTTTQCTDLTKPISCGEGRCAATLADCPCPSYSPVRCPDLTCAASDADCGSKCPADFPVKCLDNSCAVASAKCPCPASAPNRCPANTAAADKCVASLTECNAACVSPKILCWEGSCVDVATQCPCPATKPLRCPITVGNTADLAALASSGLCTNNLTTCEGSCPDTHPIRCWDSSCATDYASCPCPPEISFKCADGSCGVSEASCQTTCAAGQVTCWNQDCGNSFSDCSCPPNLPVKCSDSRGTCVIDGSVCATLGEQPSCGANKPLLCWDGACVTDYSQCTCPPHIPHACVETGQCAENVAACTNTCPVGQVKCWDSTCVQDEKTCPCPPEEPLRCPENAGSSQRCTSDLRTCVTKTCPVASPVLCWDLTCTTDLALCRCPPLEPYRCPGGNLCAVNKTSCPAVAPTCLTELPWSDSCDWEYTGNWANLTTSEREAAMTTKTGRGCTRCPSGACDELNAFDVPCQLTTRLVCPFNTVACRDGSCRANTTLCPQVSVCQGHVCGDSTCVSSPDQCPSQQICPNANDYVCSNGRCVSNATLCADVVNPDCPLGWTLCRSLACVPDGVACPDSVVCPGGFVLCKEDGVCRENAHVCFDAARKSDQSSCPPEQPVQCSDNSCAADQASCPSTITCRPGTILCPDSSCRPAGTCPLPVGCGVTDFRCPGGACLSESVFTKNGVVDLTLAYQSCPSQVKCPLDSPVLCETGHCVDSESKCEVQTECGPLESRCGDGKCVLSGEKQRLCHVSNSCLPPLTTKCSDSTCARNLTVCPTSAQMACPAGYVRCNGNECAPTTEACSSTQKCQPSQVLCPDARSCAASVDVCPVVSARLCSQGEVLCPDKINCMNTLAQCPSVTKCPADYPIRCVSDGSCREEPELCPLISACPATAPIKCPVTQACVSSVNSCPDTVICPSAKPILCWDGSCRAQLGSCPVPQSAACGSSELYCQSTRRCVSSATFSVQCPVGTLASLAQCPSSQHTRCPDGTCVTDPKACTVTTSDCPVWLKKCASTDECIPQNGICPPLANCPTELSVCSDGGCAGTPADCLIENGCPISAQTKCPSGHCVTSQSLCDAALNTCNEQSCPDGSCTPAGQTCAGANGCPANQRMCSGVQGGCVARSAPCPSSCPQEAPYRCDYGSCAKNSGACPAFWSPSINRQASPSCPSGQVACDDGSCADSPQQCPLVFPCATDEERCGDGSCRAKGTCPKTVQTCPAQAPARCPTGVCAESLDKCPGEDGCPLAAPFKCSGGTCAVSLASCPTSAIPLQCTAPLPVLCWDGSCSATVETCPSRKTRCPAATPFRCPSGNCVASARDCQGGSCPTGQQKCPADSSCAASPTACPTKTGCPLATPFKCRYDGKCVAKGTDCVFVPQCTGDLPFNCDDGSCAKDSASCRAIPACPTGEVRCPCGSCANSVQACAFLECPDSVPIRCADQGTGALTGYCAKSGQDCPAERECSSTATTPYLCIDGSCQSTPNSCARRVCAIGEASCWDGSCAPNIQDCPVIPACPAAKSRRCPDGTCVDPVTGFCSSAPTCAAGEVLCDGDGVCRANEALCPEFNGCPIGQSACPDGDCVTQWSQCGSGCATTNGKKLFKCGFLGQCVGSPSLCPKKARLKKMQSKRQTLKCGVKNKLELLSDAGELLGLVIVPRALNKCGGSPSQFSGKRPSDNKVRKYKIQHHPPGTVPPEGTVPSQGDVVNVLSTDNVTIVPGSGVKGTVLNGQLSIGSKFDTDVTLCFKVDSSTTDPNSPPPCLGFVNTTTNEWQCYCYNPYASRDGRHLCCETSHFSEWSIVDSCSGSGCKYIPTINLITLDDILALSCLGSMSCAQNVLALWIMVGALTVYIVAMLMIVPREKRMVRHFWDVLAKSEKQLAAVLAKQKGKAKKKARKYAAMSSSSSTSQMTSSSELSDSSSYYGYSSSSSMYKKHDPRHRWLPPLPGAGGWHRPAAKDWDGFESPDSSSTWDAGHTSHAATSMADDDTSSSSYETDSSERDAIRDAHRKNTERHMSHLRKDTKGKQQESPAKPSPRPKIPALNLSSLKKPDDRDDDRKKSGRSSGRRSDRKTSARESPRQSARSSPRKSARDSPRRSARESARKSARESARGSPRRALLSGRKGEEVAVHESPRASARSDRSDRSRGRGQGIEEIGGPTHGLDTNIMMFGKRSRSKSKNNKNSRYQDILQSEGLLSDSNDHSSSAFSSTAGNSSTDMSSSTGLSSSTAASSTYASSTYASTSLDSSGTTSSGMTSGLSSSTESSSTGYLTRSGMDSSLAQTSNSTSNMTSSSYDLESGSSASTQESDSAMVLLEKEGRKVGRWARWKARLKRGMILDHSWLGVYFNRPFDKVTRAQKVTLIFVVVVVCFAMDGFFYRSGNLDLLQNAIQTVMASLVATPVAGLGYLIFAWRSVRPGSQLAIILESRKEFMLAQLEALPKGSVGWLIIRDELLDEQEQREKHEKREDKRRRKAKKKGKKPPKRRPYRDPHIGIQFFPWWFVYVGYAYAAVICAACIFFTVVFGVAFDSSTNKAWILSSVIAIVQDVTINEPLSIVVTTFMSVFLSGIAGYFDIMQYV